MTKKPNVAVAAFTADEMRSILAAVEGTIDMLEKHSEDALNVTEQTAAKELHHNLKSVRRKILATMGDDVGVTHYPDTECPFCKKRLNAAAGVGHLGAPKQGDMTICSGCSEYLVFGVNLSLEKPTEDMLRSLPHDVKAGLEEGRRQIAEMKKHMY